MNDEQHIIDRDKRVTNLQDASLNLTSRILTKTFNDLGADKITPLEAAKIISLLGLRVDNIVAPQPQVDEDFIKFITKDNEVSQ